MFHNDFDSVKDVIRNYGIKESELEGATIIHADYTYEDYSGSSYVLFYKGGKFYEVHGSHCSCYGLEDQWDPEEVKVADLLARPDGYNFNSDLVFPDLKTFLLRQR